MFTILYKNLIMSIIDRSSVVGLSRAKSPRQDGTRTAEGDNYTISACSITNYELRVAKAKNLTAPEPGTKIIKQFAIRN